MNTHVQVTGNNDEISERNEHEKLFHENINLIYYMMKFYKKPYDYDNDDWFQIGAINLWSACRTFDIEKKFKFATWATKCITNGYLEVYRSRIYLNRKANYNTYSINVLISNGEPNEKLELHGMLEDKSADVESQVIANDLRNNLMKAFTTEMRISTHLFLEGYRGTEIAEIFGKTQATASRRLKILRKKTTNYYKTSQ